MPELTFTTQSVEQTQALGRRLGELLQPGDVIALVGQLGAGKTYFVKGIAAGLGVDDDRQVNSPTFVLVNEYTGRVPVHHLDVYRLGEPEELTAIGFEEMCTSDGVVIVEWADRVREVLPERTVWVEIAVTGAEERALIVRSDCDAKMDTISQLRDCRSSG